MSSPTVADTFLSLIEKSGLLSVEEIASTTSRLELDRLSSEEAIARRLVESNVLTRWQVSRLLDGRYHGFFIDEYKLLEILGVGGMGQLYVAEKQPSGDFFAVKVLADRHKEDKGMLTRLQFEARAGMRLKHPHIIQTLKIDRTRDVRDIPYIVMQFVKGVSLDELVLESGRRPWEQACDFIQQAASGLHHAHESHLIHRDIKPANLLVDREGIVRILDFGLALIEGEDESELSLTMIFGHDCVGTADYMAPEQARDSRTVDCRADLFSLGCTFYSLLSGDLPFGKTTARKAADGALELKRSRRPPSINRVREDVPEKVAAIINKMMADSVEDRFQSALDVCKALQPFAKRKPVEFDFPRQLKKRRLRAEKRLAALENARSSSKSISTAAGIDRDTMPYQSPPLIGETSDSEPGKTRPERPTIASLPSTADLVKSRLEDSKPVETSPTQNVGRLPPSAEATAYLIPLDGGEPIPLTQHRVVIGRKEMCDIQINSPLVSGEHCELIHEGHWWTVRDLKSKNGIRINGSLVSEEALWPGSRLTIAEQFHFVVDKVPKRASFRQSKAVRIWSGVAVAALAAGILIWLLSR